MGSDGMERLKVSSDGRRLVKESGKPFFWLADTAWTIATELHWKDARYYMENRRDKGFSVVQVVALDPEVDFQMRTPAGEKALIDDNPLTPNERYFEYLDKILDMAEDCGLYVLLLPAWGQLVTGDDWFGGKFDKTINAGNAYEYAKWLGERYNCRTNIVWALGGDRHPVHNGVDYRPVWRKMAEGLAKGVLGLDLKWNELNKEWNDILITYHTSYFQEKNYYSSTSYWTDEDAWIAFNMLQSGHNGSVCSYLQVAADYGRIPAKPVFDGEPNYEDMPNGFAPDSPLHDDWAVRRRAYWSLFAGSFGHTYGHSCVWCMLNEERSIPHLPFPPLPYTWREALDRPGARQMKILRDIIDSRPFYRVRPCQEIINHNHNCPEGCLENHRQACLDSEGSFALVYLTCGGTEDVDLLRLNGDRINAWWFNPRDGRCYDSIGKTTIEPFAVYDRKDTISVTTPTCGAKNDWILVLDNDASGYMKPGNESVKPE